MALKFRGFISDKRGTSFEGIALSVSIIAVGFVASADMLDYLTKPAHVDVAQVQSAPIMAQKSGDLDYAPTASLPKMISRSVLDPCTGATR